jgi:hypothetical protein
MHKNLISLLLLMMISACSAEIKKPIINNLDLCMPISSFVPTLSTITLDGIFVFSDNRSNYFYNIRNNEWSCENPKLKVVNIFDYKNTKSVFNNIESNKINKINEIQIRMADDFDFKSFVSMNCKEQGLSYLFEISSAENETIYGCQLTPNISSAVMWKQINKEPLIDIAYINLYQPFIDKILDVNSK